ncbi:Ricin B, lectin domain [Sesbania bispinosa]|nr:Ricin B, lectin domain [Sesbania bispinosa]
MVHGTCVSSRNISESDLQQASFPPRGWNSYDSFCWTISEEEFLQSAEIVSQRLHAHGYQYVVVDYLWYRKKVKGAYPDSLGFDVIDEWGRMIPDPGRWPSSNGGKGFSEVANKVHSLGLKFGIHVMRGISTQAVNANTPILDTTKGGAYQESGRVWRAKDIAIPERACAWMPHVKHDCVFGDDLDLNEITYVSEVLSKLNRPIVYSLSPGTSVTTSHGQGCSNEGPHRYSRLNLEEKRTQMTLWALAKSPLMYGGDVRKIDPTTYELITNPTLLEINFFSSNNMEFPYVMSSMNLKREHQHHGGKTRGSKKGRKTSYTHSLGLTGCTESKASGWIIESLNQDLERICWKRSLENKHQTPFFCVHKRELWFRLDGESMYPEDYQGKHQLVATDRMKFCLDASPKRKVTSKEFKRGTFSPCRWDSNQIWEFNSNGTLVNSYSGLCATVEYVEADVNSGGIRSWIATGRKGEIYMAFFNLSEQKTAIYAKTSYLAKVFPDRRINSCQGKEVWSGKDVITTQGTISIDVETHGSTAAVITQPPPPIITQPECTTKHLHIQLQSNALHTITARARSSPRCDHIRFFKAHPSLLVISPESQIVHYFCFRSKKRKGEERISPEKRTTLPEKRRRGSTPVKRTVVMALTATKATHGDHP